MYKCKKCAFTSESKSEIGNHYKYTHNPVKEFTCKKCGKKFKYLGFLENHVKNCNPKSKQKFICRLCGFEIKNNIQKHQETCNGKGPFRKRPRDPKGLGWAKGLTKDTDIRIKKISETLKNKKTHNKHTPETKKKLSEMMYERYKNGWQNKAGRCKKIPYHSQIAGDIKVDGGWELASAKYLDTLNINWNRNTKRFKYLKSDGKESTYCPDFYIKETDLYIEVKGYKTELDETKWKQFKHNLEIWDRTKLKELGLKAKWL